MLGQMYCTAQPFFVSSEVSCEHVNRDLNTDRCSGNAALWFAWAGMLNNSFMIGLGSRRLIITMLLLHKTIKKELRNAATTPITKPTINKMTGLKYTVASITAFWFATRAFEGNLFYAFCSMWSNVQFIPEYMSRFWLVLDRFKKATIPFRLLFAAILLTQMVFVSPASLLIYYLIGDQIQSKKIPYINKVAAVWLAIYGYYSRTVGTFLLITGFILIRQLSNSERFDEMDETGNTDESDEPLTRDWLFYFTYIAVACSLTFSSLSGGAYGPSTERTKQEALALGFNTSNALPFDGDLMMAAWGVTNTETAASWLCTSGVKLIIWFGLLLHAALQKCRQACNDGFIRFNSSSASEVELTSVGPTNR